MLKTFVRHISTIALVGKWFSTFGISEKFADCAFGMLEDEMRFLNSEKATDLWFALIEDAPSTKIVVDLKPDEEFNAIIENMMTSHPLTLRTPEPWLGYLNAAILAAKPSDEETFACKPHTVHTFTAESTLPFSMAQAEDQRPPLADVTTRGNPSQQKPLKI
jgi:hypothetical protein